MTAVAAIGPHSRPRSVMNPAITTGNVLDLLTLSIHANKNSFHAPTNASIADAIIPGFVNGKIILKNLFVNPQPSNIADSSSSFGSCSKNPIINQITSGRLKLVFIIISAVFVSIRCIVLITRYTGIVRIEKNGKILHYVPVEGASEEGLTDRTLLDVKSIWDFINMADIDDIREVLSRQIEYNSAIADEGLAGNYGANIGTVLLNTYGNDVRTRAKARAAAGSDARMNGCELPVVINSGSGNQGMTCSLPVLEYAKELHVSEDKTYRALALSNLIAIHQKTGIGRLSAYCGAVSAGAAAGAGIAYLCGGGYEEVIHTVVNALAIVSGMVCDGAKASCAAKIAASVDAGILGYNMYLQGQQFYAGDGIITKGIEGTIDNVGRLGKDGMKETNEEIIRIMIND